MRWRIADDTATNRDSRVGSLYGNATRSRQFPVALRTVSPTQTRRVFAPISGANQPVPERHWAGLDGSLVSAAR